MGWCFQILMVIFGVFKIEGFQDVEDFFCVSSLFLRFYVHIGLLQYVPSILVGHVTSRHGSKDQLNRVRCPD